MAKPTLLFRFTILLFIVITACALLSEQSQQQWREAPSNPDYNSLNQTSLTSSSNDEWPPACYHWDSQTPVSKEDCEPLISQQFKLPYFKIRKQISTDKRLALKDPKMAPNCEIRAVGKVVGKTDEWSLEDAAWTALSILNYCQEWDKGGYLGMGNKDLFNLEVIGIEAPWVTDEGGFVNLDDTLAKAESKTEVDAVAPVPSNGTVIQRR